MGGSGLAPALDVGRAGFFNPPTPPMLAMGGGGSEGISWLNRRGAIGGGREVKSTGSGVATGGGGRLNGLNSICCEEAVEEGGICCPWALKGFERGAGVGWDSPRRLLIREIA